MVVLSKIKPHSDAVGYFKELPFYNKPIEKPKVKILHMIDVWINNGSARMLNQLSLNTLTFQLIDLYQEVFIWTYLLN